MRYRVSVQRIPRRVYDRIIIPGLVPTQIMSYVSLGMGFQRTRGQAQQAIFHILALKSPLTIYDIQKQAKVQKGLRHIRYASVHKRVRSLEELGYIRNVGIKKTKAGFEASIYELSARAYLAVALNVINAEALLLRIDETDALTILAILLCAT